MSWAAIKSSNLRAAKYDDGEKTLDILFTNGRIYRYFEVPKEIYRDLIDESLPVSKGIYFRKRVIDGQYKFEKISGFVTLIALGRILLSQLI